MSKTKTNLQELLAHDEAYAQWFALNESLPHAAVKRNLKLLRGLSGPSKITLEELDRLTEQDIKDVVSASKTRQERSATTTAIPKTAPQFFHSIMTKSPYFSEIIPYSSSIQKSASHAATFASLLANTDTAPKNTATEPVHGFNLNKGEAFSSTRYFSKDKKSYVQIIAKDGAFQAHHQNLNHEQKTDVAFEIAFQFLLNLPPERKTVYLSGSPEMVHRMRAAFLQLQKESGARFADLDFKLPEGMSIAPGELNDAYIQKHLGALKETPQQVVQWRQFLTMEPNTPQKVNETAPKPAPKEEDKTLIDMKRVFHAPDVSQEDKMRLNEYQRYLKETWVHGISETTGHHIAEHEEFMQRTEEALRLFQKAPSLKKEFEALKTLYIDLSESHYKMLEELHQNDIAYERQMKEVMPQLKKAQRGALEDCLHIIEKRLEMELTLNPDLSEDHQKNLLRHQQAIQEMNHFIQDKEELSDEMMRSCCTQINHAISSLESVREYSSEPQFQQVKQFSKEQSEKKEKISTSAPERLAHAAQQVKERLNLFKQEFNKPESSEIHLDSKMKEQLESLSKKIDRFTDSIETDEDKDSLKSLSTTLQKMSESSSISKEQLESLHQEIDKALPRIDGNQGLAQALSDIKTLIKADPVPLSPPREESSLPEQSM
jgi:hypothetical protein